MKTRFLGWAFIAAMTGLTSCNESESLEQESEIKLTSEIAATRAGTDVQSTAIEVGASVGVNLTNVKTSKNSGAVDLPNSKWTVGENGVMTKADGSVYYSVYETAVTAYCPYDENAYGINGFSVKEDQSEDANYIASDLLWANEQTSMKQTGTIDLTFTHQLAKITVVLESADGYDLDGAVVTICGTIPDASFNSTNGTVEVKSGGTAKDIKAGTLATSGTLTDTNNAVSAIIIPQTMAAGTKFINVLYKDRNFSFKLSSSVAKQFEGGHAYKYRLSVDEKDLELQLKEVKITDWTDETEETGTAEEEWP